MERRKLLKAIFAAGILFSFLLSSRVFAVKWQAFNFKGNEKFEYEVGWGSDTFKKKAFYTLEIRKTGREEGEDIFEVTYITKGKLKKSELGPETAFGLWSAYGISLNVLMLNPAYAFFFSQLDLKVGEKISFYGAGVVEISGKMKIAGIDGFICQFFEVVEGQKKLMAEWVINPQLPLPLK
ncbi:hypothetical protein H5U35_02745, partial [Candidatus Aerophobetes bacterium]|nr:hypothetical protein [Candidatus Aerophobetes bacterium]